MPCSAASLASAMRPGERMTTLRDGGPLFPAATHNDGDRSLAGIDLEYLEPRE